MRHGLSFLLIAKGGIVGERVELLHGNVGLNSFMGTSSRHGSSGRWREARRDRAADTSPGMEWLRGRNIGALTRQLPGDRQTKVHLPAPAGVVVPRGWLGGRQGAPGGITIGE